MQKYILLVHIKIATLFVHSNIKKETNMTYEQMADREQARNWGYLQQDEAWILTDRDVWHKNPFYCGPPVPHPDLNDDCHNLDTESHVDTKPWPDTNPYDEMPF